MFLIVVNVSEMSLQVAGDGKANLEMFLLVVNVFSLRCLCRLLEMENLTWKCFSLL
jgi:hypothetical protein